MDLTWLGCAATTGEVIAELPGLVVTGALQQVIGAYSTLSATLPITDGVSPDWVAATEPNGSYLVLLADGEPVDGYLVTKRDSTDGDTVALGLANRNLGPLVCLQSLTCKGPAAYAATITERWVSNEPDESVVIKSDGCCDHGRSGHGVCHDLSRGLLIESRG